MRQIIFKGQQVDTKQWVEGFLIKTEKGECYIFNYHFIPAKSVPSEKFIEVIPETVSQFTGIVDKNKKQIFENDICLNGNDHHVLIGIGESIYLDDEGFDCKCYGVFVEYRDLKHPFIIGITTDFVSVVGNKFDNAELISF